MRTIELLDLYKNKFTCLPLSESSLIVYAPYYLPNGDNYPLQLSVTENEVCLTAEGEMSKVFEEYNFVVDSYKLEIDIVLVKYGMTYSNGVFELKCNEEELNYAISSYFQALSTIFNLKEVKNG